MASIINNSYCRITGSRISVISLCAILVLAIAWASPVHAVAVACGSGGSGIQTQLDLGNDVEFTGTCVEDISIGGDGLDVDGGGSGIIQGEISVRGADRVRLEGFTVQNPSGGDAGVFITEGAHIDLRNVTFSNLNEGFCVARHAFVDIDGLTSTTQTAPTADACTNVNIFSGSVVRMINSTITNDTDVGGLGAPVYAVRGSTLTLRGNNSITNNGTDAALGVYAGSHAREDNGSTGTGNTIVGAATGFDVWQDSSFDMRQATVTASENFVGFDSALKIGSSGFGGDPANITVSGDVIAYRNATMDIHTAANMNGTVSCFTNSTISLSTTALGGTGSVDCPYRVQSGNGTAKVLVDENSATVADRTLFQIENNGRPHFGMLDSNSGALWDFLSGGAFFISRIGSGATELTVGPFGDVVIAGALTQNSSQANKVGIDPVDSGAILAKVLELPIAQWSYKHDVNNGIRHVGPMAEDFSDAFGLGAGNKGISSIDTGGVALAAIQGLKTEKDRELLAQASEMEALTAKQDKELAALRQENDAEFQALRDEKDAEISVLRGEVDELKRMMKSLMSRDQVAAMTFPSGDRE